MFYTKQFLVQVALPDYKGLLPTGDKSRREGLSSGHWFHMRQRSLNLLSLEENPAEETEIHGNENICIIAVLVKCIFIWGCF